MPPLARTHGAQVQEDGTTRFALWAPDCREVTVELVSNALHPLQAQADGWFVGTCECPAGTGYRFVIDGHLRVPDPASQAQLDDVHGFSQVVDHRAYPWRHAEWQGRPWHESVLYELHVGLFGGYAGVEQHLPLLAGLGITAIELMPLAEFPGSRNWGYDGVLPFAPESSYGTPEQLKSLIDSAHGLGLMVFVDVVYNHFGPDGNYLGNYSRDFFRSDVQTPWGAAIDFRRRQVRDYFCENALMWLLDYRVDGLRLDAVHAIGEPDFLVELASRVHAAVEPGRHVHLVLENEDNNARLLQQGFTAQWNDDGHNVLHALLTGEREGYYGDFADDATAKLARCLGEGFIYQGQNSRHGCARGEPSAHLPPTAFVLFLQNHDQVGNRAFGERLIELADEDALRAATALLLLSPMVPLLFMGEEWGARQPFLFFTDHHAELADLVRIGRRNEFADFALYADAEVRETIPDPNAPATFARSQLPENLSSQVEHQNWHALYQQLLDLRHRLIIPRLPGARALKSEVLAEGAVSAQWTLGDRSLLRIDLNLSASNVWVSPPPTSAAVIFVWGVDSAGYQLGTLPARSVAVSLEAAP
ncbi:malto-oligosyltrehalose trehalohydrolase [Pseudomonas sp. PDM14]|uniref:malto-oligosyltrehalose trehalohydrolase n=1 Tax=Pseudomonas sp. PDM14 TaxID=2769288 RepID=UPI00177B657C|nr:malto-oligosyltrehalose trehalohydrolase [Pseudomonas sp. PDM14]MBD9484084.1 malto-oligosyltrehalose trehalohydrolase [Pseudomonas sp. PDM14]